MAGWIADLFLCHPSLGFGTKLGDGLHFAAALARLSATPAVVAKIRERAKSVRSRKQPKWLGPQTKMQCHATRLSQTSRRATFKPRCPPQRTLVHGIPLVDTPTPTAAEPPSTTSVFDTLTRMSSALHVSARRSALPNIRVSPEGTPAKPLRCECPLYV